ncbi:uncharacterized protein N7482_001376 [Penicillium canariense]|uniref:Uncharacterized protein n=1 Tax=Penicillium canariense TaxID=189055 RepID=A0A9W9IFV3_9EURO|nr:uncharacterized protein N7482_001376 [Penicillium canariense]KAJ5175499.1 hypothetical protein N7482_001376 [Penicillium canariense]
MPHISSVLSISPPWTATLLIAHPCLCDPLGAIRPYVPRIATRQDPLGEIRVREVPVEARCPPATAVPGVEVDPPPVVDPDPAPALAVPAEVVDATGARVIVAHLAQIKALHKAQRKTNQECYGEPPSRDIRQLWRY